MTNRWHFAITSDPISSEIPFSIVSFLLIFTLPCKHDNVVTLFKFVLKFVRYKNSSHLPKLIWRYPLIQTVDGRNPAPVGVGSFSHYFFVFFSIPGGWPWDFWSINSSNKYIIPLWIGNLGGETSNMFYFHPDLGIWWYDPIWRTFFQIGLVQPPTSSSILLLLNTTIGRSDS